jgi:hypothetical protein
MGRPLKEWQPAYRDCADGKRHLAYAHRASMRGKNDQSRNLILVILYHRRYTLKKSDGLMFAELLPLVAPVVGSSYLEHRLRNWSSAKWAYLTRGPVVNANTRRTAFAYVIAKRGKHVIEDVLTRAKLLEYIAILQSVRRAAREEHNNQDILNNSSQPAKNGGINNSQGGVV